MKNNGQYKITKCGHNQTGIYFLNNRTTSGRIAILQTKKFIKHNHGSEILFLKHNVDIRPAQDGMIWQTKSLNMLKTAAAFKSYSVGTKSYTCTFVHVFQFRPKCM